MLEFRQSKIEREDFLNKKLAYVQRSSHKCYCKKELLAELNYKVNKKFEQNPPVVSLHHDIAYRNGVALQLYQLASSISYHNCD